MDLKTAWPGSRPAIVVLDLPQINLASHLFPALNALPFVRVAAWGSRCFCELRLVSGHPTHDFFFWRHQSVRPIDSIDFGAPYRLLERGFFAWAAPIDLLRLANPNNGLTVASIARSTARATR
jgi:hypothetical protein